MDSGQGMVAVVRGLGDSQLAVTLLDSGKQYTLLPTSALQPTNQQNERSSSTNTPYQQYHQSQCHAGAQATDGQYTTVYKATHCKVRPTSPPIQLTEFPPQRAAVAPGEGNFEVGGTGSGDTSFNFMRTNGTYRGAGMVWPDRGCICSPRASREPDSFADSLRKYPAISPERSAEIVERLINYTQGKNFAKVMRQSSLSPTRLSAEQNDRSPSRGSSHFKACDLEKIRYRFQGESPTKERPRKTERLDSDGESRRTFTKNFDVRYVKDMSRKVKDGMRNNPYMAQYPSIREAFEIMNDHTPASQRAASHGGHSSTLSGIGASVAPLMVNSQTQAAASMACKKVSTDSRHKMFSRNVEVPLSPPSDVNRPPEGAVFDPRPPLLQASVQTLVIPLPVTVKKSVQTTQSSIDISSVKTTLNTKKCRSQIEFSNREVREEILGWLIDVMHTTYSKKLRADVIDELREKLKYASNNFGGEEAKVTLNVESIDDDCCKDKDNLENICDELANKVQIKNRYLTQIYRAEVVSYRTPEDLKKAIKDWLLELPIKTKDYCGKHIDEEQMLANFVKKLKKALFSPDYDTKKLRNEVVKILKDLPIDYGSTNQSTMQIYLNRLANNLIKKLLNANGYSNKHKITKFEVDNKLSKKKFHPNENEVRDLVRDEIIDFLDKFDIKVSLERLQDLESDILGTVMTFLYSSRSNSDERFIDDVAHALQGIGAFEHQTLYFANLILDHLKELIKKLVRNERDQVRRLHMMTVLNSAVNETKRQNNNQNNLDDYIQILTQQIDEWLAGLELEIPWSQDESFRQVVVNDLAEDIIDRHKYVQMNLNVSGTEKDELEYLKYLIFKWINKLVGEEHQETIEHAPELLRRIRTIPVPLLIKSNANCNLKLISPEFSQTPNERATSEPGPPIGYSASKNFQAYPVPIAGPSRIENPSISTTSGAVPPNMGKFLEGIRVPTIPGIKNMQTLQYLNHMYDDFVRKWVQTIPIPAYTPEERALAEKMRVGLYNGIFQIVTKLRFQPQLLFNPFYYQDALGEELEELLALLPQTPEFLKHKNQIKALMIEKTTEVNELIKIISSPDTFKGRCVHKYHDFVPRLSTNLSKECPLRLYEELQILNIAEDFLLFTKYKEEDPLKAYMYRQKLIERIKELITEMKKVHGTELKNINPEMYMNEVMETLQQVPIPSNEEMREEAEEILLGHAIEEWYMALPLAHNNNLFEQLKRRHLRNALTKKIQNMEKSLIASDNTPEYELRHEISKFLEQIPLGKDETGNINYMVDALVDKVKNIVTPNPQVDALYNTSLNYSGFGENAALHSTTVHVPEGYRLVGPLPPCCAAGLDKILPHPGPSGFPVQSAGGLATGQNLKQPELPQLERRASMISGGPPLATQSFGQQSSGGQRENLSPEERKRHITAGRISRDETSRAAQDKSLKVQSLTEENREEERQNIDSFALASSVSLATADGENTQRKTSFGTQADPSSGKRRPSMGESEQKTKFKTVGEAGSIQILQVSGSTSGHRKPSMNKLEYDTHSTGGGQSGSARGQRKPSMGVIGKNTQPEITQKQTCFKDSKNRDRSGERTPSKYISESDTHSSTQKETSFQESKKRNEQRQTNRDMLGKDSESTGTQKETIKNSRVERLQTKEARSEYDTESQTTQKQIFTNDYLRQTTDDKSEYDKDSRSIQKETSANDSKYGDAHRPTQNSHREITTNEQRCRLRQCPEQTIECSTILRKISGLSSCKLLSQTSLCYCNKANTEKNSLGENKQCLCAKSSKEKLNTGSMSETRACLCKGTKVCLCRNTIVSADIGGQTSNQAVSDKQSTFNRTEYPHSGNFGQGTHFQVLGETGGQSTLDHTEYSVSGKPGQGKYFQQQRPGTDYDYDRQMTQESSTLTNNRSLAQPQGLYQQGNIHYTEPLVDKRQASGIVRGHFPGPTFRDARDAQMASGAFTGSGGGGIARDGFVPTSMVEQGEIEQSMSPSSLAQPGSRRLSHRVSIISPESQERLRLLSETSMAPTDQQGSRGERSAIPQNVVGTYEGFEGGRPRSSSLKEQALGEPSSIEQQRGYLQPQDDNSMPNRRASAVPLHQSSPIQNFDPRLVSPLPGGLNATTLSDISTPQWITVPQSSIEAGYQLTRSGMETGYQAATKPCACPPYVSMLSPEQVSMISPQRTGFGPSQIFAPAFSPGQMFDQMIPPGQSLPSMFFGPNGTLPDPNQFRQARMSQLQQSSIGQPFQGDISQLIQGSMGQPFQGGMSPLRQGNAGPQLQGRMSQSQRAGVSQPLQGMMSQLQPGNISQPRQFSINQPLQGRVSQLQQGMMSPGSLQDSRYTRYISKESPGAVAHDFPAHGGPDGRYTMQMSQEDRSVLMQTIPQENQSVQPDVQRRISMPNRTQNLQDSLLEGGQSGQPGAVQRIQEERSIVQGNIRSTQEENAPGRTNRASMQATFSQNIQSRSRQDSMHTVSPEQVEEIAQLRALQNRRMSQSGAGGMQRRESQGISLIPTIEEDEQQNISVQTGTQRASWQIPRQDVTLVNVPQESDNQEMSRSEAGMSQADRRASQAIRRASQGATDHSAGWLSFNQSNAPQNVQASIYQEMIPPDTRISQAGRGMSQSTVGEPIALNYPSISADQSSFQQAVPSPALQDTVEQIPIGLQGPVIMYPPAQQDYQNDVMMAGYVPGQPGQVIQDPRTYIQPAAFSTPQRPIPPDVPRRPVKRGGKRRRPRKDDGSNESEQRGRNFDDGRLLESDSDSDHGLRIRCRCYERLRCFRRRNDMYEEECDIPCPYAHYYYSCF